MWTCKVKVDLDKSDVGTVTATFTDTDSTTFTITERVQITASARDAFIVKAITARDLWKTKKTAEAGYVTNVQNRFAQLDV